MINNKKIKRLLCVLVFFSLIVDSSWIESAGVEGPRYEISSGDALSIFVWREEELTRNITVMADGRISFPLIGSILAQGKTVTDLKDEITTELKKYIDAPEVTVIVNASSNRIFTIGNLNAPGPQPLTGDMTVLQALSISGGFSQWADKKNIMIIRRQSGSEVQIKFNYIDFIDGKKIEQNILLQPNDTIIVP